MHFQIASVMAPSLPSGTTAVTLQGGASFLLDTTMLGESEVLRKLSRLSEIIT